MNVESKDKLIHTAVPSIFDVPNPPSATTIKRKLPQHYELLVTKRLQLQSEINDFVNSQLSPEHSNQDICNQNVIILLCF
jgi:hypothetical protein